MVGTQPGLRPLVGTCRGGAAAGGVRHPPAGAFQLLPHSLLHGPVQLACHPQQHLRNVGGLQRASCSRRRLACRAQTQPQPASPQQPQQPQRAPSPGLSAARPRLPVPAAAAAAGAGAYAVVAAAEAPPAVPVGGGGVQPQQQPPEPAPQQEGRDEPEVVLLIIACGIGLATGAAIVAFNVGVHAIRDVIWENQSLLASNRELLRNIGESELWPKVVFPPFVGGLVVGGLGYIIQGYDDKPAPKVGPVAGSGGGSAGARSRDGDAAAAAASAAATSAAMQQWRVEAVLRPVWRAVAAAVTLGTGASLGPEGPSVDIGKSTANALGSSLRSRQRHLTSLLAAGAGAGVAAGFNAPISGVFFAVETVLQKQQLPKIRSGADPAAAQRQLAEAQQSLTPSALTIAMVLLAAVLAAVVSQAGLGSSPAFRVPEYRLESLIELPLYLVFGATCGVVSASCSFSTRVATDAFNELREQNSFEAALLPCIGGLTTGVLALGYPEILYQGFDNVNNILSSSGAYAPGLLIQIVVMKVIATSICRGSGLQGGLYAPSIFIGAALGTAFGLLAHVVADPIGLELSAPQAYALVGVAAMLASNCQVPLTSVLLLFELTRDYLIILPTLAAVGISFWISSLAAPSVKNAAAARRMSATAAASAAVATTALTAAATEAALLGSLKGRLAAVKPAQAPAGAAGAADGEGPAIEAVLGAVVEPVVAAGFVAGSGSGSGSGTLDGFYRAATSPATLAAAAASAGEPGLPVSAALERSCLLVEAEMTVARALELMLVDDQHVAVVLGNDGGVMGLVTRDVLEQCVAAADDVHAAAAAANVAEAAGEGQAAKPAGSADSGSGSSSD